MCTLAMGQMEVPGYVIGGNEESILQFSERPLQNP
jgi:hypothetical protein